MRLATHRRLLAEQAQPTARDCNQANLQSRKAMLDGPAGKLPSGALRRLIGLLWVVVIAIVLVFGYFASSLCITFLLAGFLAVLIDPIPTALERWHIARSLSSALLVVSGVVGVGLLVYGSYGKASELIDRVPEYAARIHDGIRPLSQNIEKMQKGAGSFTPDPSPKKIPEVRISQAPNWSSYLIRGVGSVWGAVIIAGVVPFLTFFMLVRKAQISSWLSNTFGENVDIPQFIERLTQMVRGFIVGNVIIGSIIAGITVAVLLSLKMQGAVALGIASGILNLVPFVGVLLAAILPLMAATLQFYSAGPFVVILLTTISLHLISANFLIPKLIGSRVNIGPVAATMGLLFWGWLWGLMGLLLAVPLTAVVKLIADCHPSLVHISNLLAETPRSVPNWAQTGHASVTRAIQILPEGWPWREKH
jgi:predicted PurR-regulated permease PerM